MINEQVKATGKLCLEIRGADGALKESLEFDNLVVSTGLAFIASRMIGVASPVMSHMAIGTGTAVPSLANSTLGGEAGRVALTSSNAVSGVVTYIASFPAGTGTGAITEAGVFDNSAGGVMLNRVTFSVVNKGALDTMTITWTVTLS